MKDRPITDAERKRVLSLVKQGVPREAIRERLGLGKSSLKKILKKARVAA